MILKEAYESVNDKFRALGYTKAIAALKKYPKPITSKEEALQIPRVGKRLADKIGEIIASGHLQRLDYIGEDVQVMEMFTKVYGAGPYQAQVWYNQGFRTLEDLRTKAVLNRDQKIGLKYYEDLNQRMPREEVANYAKVVMEVASEVDPKLQCYVAGSFRRLKPTCGDIDILITRDPSDGKSHQGLLAKIVAILSERKFLTDDLALPADETGAKYMGICQLNGGLHRHIDLLLVPYKQLGAALLYFTGSDIFNRSMRLLAIKKGMMLNMHGLYDQVLRGRKRKNLSEGRLIASSTEREIFERLGMPYR
ncbi:Nucleotidyltransferase [Basidiobolus meristosporus CBS 931.73]|uniref:DNA polymerase n=1 Tax=Basidiobolus meristosporus CBS 931.73 TaxID=1314790 RepID=A0A1Y1Y3C6_9FUNG|nr:Nucleotidyltransferase [Basidiobolus meristosporus CBS 931.73]|eukprot:ORX92507.1 Nucleotidyltransferase [Basidiobolus meristosporus CBS 931.73]